MKIYGYSNNTNDSPMELSEATISANPDILRELADFLNICADEITRDGSSWEHEHFISKNSPSDGSSLQLIIFNSGAK